MEINQYHIIIVNLDPTIGSEIKKTRPCVVVSPDEMNKHLNTVVIAPITSQDKKYPTRIRLTIDNQPNWIAIDQIRTIDKVRVMKKIGELSGREIALLKSKIKETYVD
jgi:mRNA interferase MazF